MKMVTGKVGAFITKVETFFIDAPVNTAGFGHAVERHQTVFIAASTAAYLFNRDTPVLSDLCF
jgi:hypothetical protein